MLVNKMYTSIDTHVLGEAFRIVVQSPIMLADIDVHRNNEQLQNNFTTEKDLILNEPRGHRGINGCIIAPSKVANYQLLFFNHDHASSFKYEGLAASLTALLETGNLNHTKDDLYHIETVKGIFTLEANIVNGEVMSIIIENNNAKVIDFSDHYFKVNIDDDRYYYMYELPEHIETIDISNLESITNWGINKTATLNEKQENYEGVILVEKEPSILSQYKSVTFEKDGYIKRTPGIDSTIAIFTAIVRNETVSIDNESIFGSKITALKASNNDKIFTLQFRPFVTGSHQFVFDNDDPLKSGFLLK